MRTIAITMGDAAGVGPEILLRAYDLLSPAFSPVVYGNASILAWAQEDLLARGILTRRRDIRRITSPDHSIKSAICVLDCTTDGTPAPSSSYPWGQAVAAFGRLQYEALQRAIRDGLDRRVDALVTLPWHKSRLRDAGLPPTGHTEVLQQGTDSPHAIMVLCGDVLRVALQTIHIPLKDVPGQIDGDAIVRTAKIFAAGLERDWNLEKPRIAICGLNPHAGEDGVLGTEDRDIIAPAIMALQQQGVDAQGPFPADTIFPLVAHGQLEFDGILAMYHDQGLGPLKTWHFGQSANVTVGMPIIRTSVDHGTAYDIAGQGTARVDSFLYAYKLAGEMVGHRAASQSEDGAHERTWIM